MENHIRTQKQKIRWHPNRNQRKREQKSNVGEEAILQGQAMAYLTALAKISQPILKKAFLAEHDATLYLKDCMPQSKWRTTRLLESI